MVTTMITTMPRMPIQKPRRVNLPDCKRENKTIIAAKRPISIPKNLSTVRGIVIPIIPSNPKTQRNNMARTGTAKKTIAFFIGDPPELIEDAISIQ